MTKKLIFLIFIIAGTSVFGQGPWIMTGRVHNELKWHTLTTEHYRVHYHQGIEEIAQQGASMAEQIHSTLLKQVGLETVPMIDVIFTTEDEIMNGYAMPANQTFIWVDQNDAAIWLEDEKWLYQVLAHELQHIMYFNAVKTWMPEPFSSMGIPGWFVEGLAEYMTERWRPHRADISHKYHVYKNKMDEMDPHHDGYSKLLMMGEKWGDSTIVNIIQHRNLLGLLNFKKAFKKYTDISLEQFEEDWRRTMNTYYYGYRSQKETYQDLGEVETLPIKKMSAFSISPDSLHIALVGRDDKDQWDQSLFIAVQDTSKPKEDKLKKFIKGIFEKKKDRDKMKPPKPKYKKEELDFGRFHQTLAWTSDNNRLAYAKFRYGKYGSFLWDIRIYDREEKQSEWVTENKRAAFPVWDQNETGLYYISHEKGVANIFHIDLTTKADQAITSYEDDIQIMTPALSPDGKSLVYAMSPPNANTDLYLLSLESKESTRLTDDPAVDYLPVWHPDGESISYTSHSGSTPNIHTVEIASGESRMLTDCADGIWSVQWNPKGSSILAKTLTDVDSVRIVEVDPGREITTTALNLRKDFTSWRVRSPEHILTGVNPQNPVTIIKDEKYKFLKYFRHMTSILIPLKGPLGLTIWNDALGKHLISGIGGYTRWDFTTPYYTIGYTNAQHGPLWGVNFYHNFAWSFREYDETTNGLIEKFDGGAVWFSIPFNRGDYMTANHSFTVNAAFHNRQIPTMPYDSTNAELDTIYYHEFSDLPTPEGGEEGVLTLAYTFTQRRPHKSNMSLPTKGWGAKGMLDIASKELFGDFSYNRLTLDSYFNHPLKPAVLFVRGKAMKLWGDPPAQEYVGFSRDEAIYFPGSSGTGGLYENMNIRGFDQIKTGDLMAYGTAELRVPLISSIPAHVLDITIGDISGAVFSDFGQVWDKGRETGDIIITAGYELKYAWKIEDIPLFFISVGYAQELERWQEDKEPIFYVRSSLINPF